MEQKQKSTLIGIMGDTGRGKSFSFVVPPDGKVKKDSYNGMNPWDTFYVSYDKELPFKRYVNKFPKWKETFIKEKDKKVYNWFETNVLQTDLKPSTSIIRDIAKKSNIKNIILDTISIAMHDSRMKREREIGFKKWSDLGLEVYELLNYLRNVERDDLFIWWFTHIEFEKNREGDIEYKSKVEGNMLNKMLEKWTNHIFLAVKEESSHIFETQSNNSTAKNPPLLFEETIPNSMKLINDVLRYE